MSRDYRKLHVFKEADVAVEVLYRATRTFPVCERYGLQSQMRRAAVSVPCNLVEGASRRSLAEYAHFVNVATASAAETAYLVDLAHRLGFLGEVDSAELGEAYARLSAKLTALLTALEDRQRVSK